MERTFGTDDLRRLVEDRSGPTVSITLPIVRRGSEVEQNPVRLGNLVRTAAERLDAMDADTDDLRAVLDDLVATALEDSPGEPREAGLALYASPGQQTLVRADVPFTERVTVGDRYDILPVVAWLQVDGRFTILAVSQNRVRRFDATRDSIREVDDAHLPKDLRSALRIDEYSDTLQQHVAGPTGATGSVQFHGQGGSDPDVRKRDEIEQFLRTIEAGLRADAVPEDRPLVFAGVASLLPIFRKIHRGRGLVEEPLAGNPDETSAEQLHRDAWPLVEPLFRRGLADARERTQNALGTGLAASDDDTLLRAARQGAVDTLFVTDEGLISGTSDASSAAAPPTRDEADRRRTEFHNRVACETVLHGGTVYCIPRDEIPGDADATALLRYPVPAGQAAPGPS